MPREVLSAARTPVAFVQAILRACTTGGLEVSALLRKAQIAPSDLQPATARVSATQFERLCAAAMQALDDEAPGWFSRPLPWGSYGMLARASISAPTLGVALRRWCRHHGLLTQDVRLTLDVRGDQAHLSLTESRPLPPALREFALLSLLRNAHGLACWWIDANIALHEASFPFAAPPHADVYARLFPGPVRFDAAGAALQFDARLLARPLRRDGAALDAMLRRALPLMVLPWRRDGRLALHVRHLLRERPALTAESLAAELGLSVRSLHRQLAAEGTRLQALKDEVRRARACALLLRGRQPIKQIAQEAGFASDKTFLRAFRGWTGQTPEQFRASGGAP